MKPRSKKQEFMVAWAQAHTALTPRQHEYANKHCFGNVSLVSRGKCYCTKCKSTWRDRGAGGQTQVTCPHCGEKLEVVAHKTKIDLSAYFSVFTTVDGMQVCKWYYMYRLCKNNGTEETGVFYVGTEFLSADGKLYSVEIGKNPMSWRRDAWYFGSAAEIRRHSVFREYITADASYYERILPTLKRYGFKTDRTYRGVEMAVMQNLLSVSNIESLVKCGHVGVVLDCIHHGAITNPDELTLIKLANRHHVVFDTRAKWRDYLDYLHDLKELGKDIHNPTILFPDDFQKAHQDVAAKVAVKRERARRERERQYALENLRREKERQKWVSKYAAKFTGMMLVSGTFTVKPLISGKEFETEGEVMHHCIESYYGKPDTLLLSIEHNGEKCETAEIALKRGEIIQCRGCCNKPTEYHDIIVKMLERFMSEFLRRYKTDVKQNTLPILASHYKTYQKAI